MGSRFDDSGDELRASDKLGADLHSVVSLCSEAPAAAPHGSQAVTAAAALYGAEHGITGLPGDLISALELGWVGDRLARDAVAQIFNRPGGGEYEIADDPTWWSRYPSR